MRAATSILIAALAITPAFAEQGDDDDEDAALAALVKNAPVTLAQGFAAAAREGAPISGKFEFEVDGGQLSVYTARGDAFTEVIVDHRSGRIAKVIPITEGDDLVHAKEQMSAMRQAGRSLEEVTTQALAAHAGFRAVSATPGRRDARADGAPVVKLVLTDGTRWETVYEPLDRDY
jgi:hypothetical protein